jgi:hypothetical protein
MKVLRDKVLEQFARGPESRSCLGGARSSGQTLCALQAIGATRKKGESGYT